jgi:hypothetical protein
MAEDVDNHGIERVNFAVAAGETDSRQWRERFSLITARLNSRDKHSSSL